LPGYKPNVAMSDTTKAESNTKAGNITK